MEGLIENNQTVVQSLYTISQIAAKAKNLDELWQPLFSEVLKIMQVDAGTLMILEGDSLVRKTAHGLGEEIMKEPPIEASRGGVSWKAVKTKQEVVLNDLSQADIASEALKAGHFHSLITVPMMVRSQVIGVISIFTQKERNFSEADLSLFKAIANQAALAIISLESEKLLAINKERMEELAALNQISQSVESLFDFEETLYTILALITRQFKADIGVITLFDHRNKLLKAAPPAINLKQNQISDFRHRYDEGIMGEVFCKGMPKFINVLDKETKEVLSRGGIQGVKSVLVAPLKVKSQSLGVINLFILQERNFSKDDLKLFTILSSQAAVVVNSSIILREISEERKKDEALLASIGEGVLAIDRDEKIILLNASGENITGYLAEEIIGKHIFDGVKFCDSAKKEISLPLVEVLSSGKTMMMDNICIKRRHGDIFPARLSIAPTLDAENKIIGAIIVFSDITKEIEIEKMKQELISISTHELRAPITGIKGYLDMILDGDTGGVNQETKETVEELVLINQRLADLVEDLLNVGRIEQGRIAIRPEPTDLEKLITEIIKELSAQAKKKGLEVKFLPKKLSQVQADPDKTKQIIMNLLSNAIKYTPKGKIEIATEDKGDEIYCHVSDTGFGISPQEQKKLFQKFYRVKNKNTWMITGTGLGLWISQKFLEMMKGKIWLISKEGKGSTFSFSLPKA